MIKFRVVDYLEDYLEKGAGMEGKQGKGLTISILGARGSMASEGEDMLEYGGATSCVLAESAGQAIFFDAGTGIMAAPQTGDEAISLFFTHTHLDHVIGLPFFPQIFERDKRIDVYGPSFNGEGIKGQLDRLFVPPYWPCTIDKYPADIRFNELELPIKIGEVLIEGINGSHPGGSIIYKVSAFGKSAVYATDYEYTEDSAARLIAFAKDTDLLRIDAQYTDEEYKTRNGFGHSTLDKAMVIAKECMARNVRIVHHDPRHNDQVLKSLENKVKDEHVMFARRGEKIEL